MRTHIMYTTTHTVVLTSSLAAAPTVSHYCSPLAAFAAAQLALFRGYATASVWDDATGLEIFPPPPPRIAECYYCGGECPAPDDDDDPPACADCAEQERGVTLPATAKQSVEIEVGTVDQSSTLHEPKLLQTKIRGLLA